MATIAEQLDSTKSRAEAFGSTIVTLTKTPAIAGVQDRQRGPKERAQAVHQQDWVWTPPSRVKGMVYQAFSGASVMGTVRRIPLEQARGMTAKTGPADALPPDLPLPVINAAQGVGVILEGIIARTGDVIAMLNSTVGAFSPTDAD